MEEIVLRCCAEMGARSAREIRCRVRIKFKTRFRLICRGVLFEALCFFVKVKGLMEEDVVIRSRRPAWPCIAPDVQD